jgi:hypothetical protein
MWTVLERRRKTKALYRVAEWKRQELGSSIWEIWTHLAFFLQVLIF